MPRLPTLHLEPLADLLQQLRYAPREARLRQLRAAEELAAELNHEQDYPHSYIVFRLTSYRPDLSSREEPIYAGAELLVELAIFTELLCDTLNLSRADLDQPSYTTEELKDRWQISTRTLSRYRKQGLLAHRVVDDGQPCLVFTHKQVQRFEQLRADQLGKAKRFSRIGPDLKARIIHRAARYHDVLDFSLNQSAARLARRFNRGHETVRQLLLRHDSAMGDDAIFRETGPVKPRDREILHRAWRRGVPIEQLCIRFARNRSSVHRVISEQRAALLRRLDLSGPMAATFERPDAASVLLAPAPACEGVLPPHLARAEDLLAFAEAHDQPELEIEQAQCVALAFLRFAAMRHIGTLTPHQPSATTLDGIETSLRWASRLKARLICGHSRLAVQTIERFLGRSLLEIPADEIRRLHAMFITAFSDAVDRHDVFKGGRLAAPAGLLLTRALGRHGAKPAESLARARPGAAATIPDWRWVLDPWQDWLDLPIFLLSRLDQLDAELRSVLALRCGLGAHHPLTAEQVGEEMNATRQRVLRLERQAISALYNGAGDH